MAVTRSTPQERKKSAPAWSIHRQVPRRGIERVLLLLATLVIVAGVSLTAKARVQRSSEVFATPLNLNLVERREQLLPVLQWIPSATERQYAAGKLLSFLQDDPAPTRYVRELDRARVPLREVQRTRGLPDLQARAKQLRDAHPQAEAMPLFRGEDVARMRPMLSVRDASGYNRSLLLWTCIFVLAFWAVHLFWSVRGGNAPPYVLPCLLLISGVGLSLMITLRDPLRDSLAFASFAQGAGLGCLVMLIASKVEYRRVTGRLSYIFLFASFALSAALILFGTGPQGSDARIRLLGFQPAEVIRILIVFFLAGYFAQKWEFLRQLRDERAQVAKISRWIEVPRLEYLIPVVAGVVLCLVFFFLQKDLGPALLIACLFLALYAVARDRYLFASGGLLLILSGFASGYFLHIPKHVAGRVAMWLSPWDNTVRGGEQVAQSLWGFSSGGFWGAGFGLGDPQVMPAAHTDLILSTLGEEWGFVGFACVMAIYAALIWFGFRTALRSRSDYNFFLALGLTLALALQIALIAAGVLDLAPLSGVVVPFLSYGRTALITNFAIIGVLCALAREQDTKQDHTEPFRTSTRNLSYVVAAIGFALLAKAAYVQTVRADATAGAGALAVQADGERRYQYNPRLLAIARSIPRGSIYDRNGVPLATSDWQELQRFRDAYSTMGITLPQSDPGESRYYPLGAMTVHLLGDLRTRANWGAPNSSLLERDAMVALQGYDDRARVVQITDPQTKAKTTTVRYDLRELLPLLRHRWQPDAPEVKKVRERDRNVHMSIDAALQMRTAQLLEAQLRKLGKDRGAAVVMDAASGDLLASVSYPWPAQMPPKLEADDSNKPLFDRARYGLYPPGSSFKLVTAMAALRKDPNLTGEKYQCVRLPDGRVGNFIKGWARPIHDDIKDTAPHGTVDMRSGLIVSCNAYFAQLGTYVVGPRALLDTANLFGISVATPATVENLRGQMPQASYGQGQVVASPFQMARVAATVADGGDMPFGRWLTDANNTRTQSPAHVIDRALAKEIADDMRGVVTSGTGRTANTPDIAIAGKTGTAELQDAASHAWFIGFAPYQGTRKLSFAVLIENGQYGGTAAAPLAAEIMKAAKQFGYFQEQP